MQCVICEQAKCDESNSIEYENPLHINALSWFHFDFRPDEVCRQWMKTLHMHMQRFHASFSITVNDARRPFVETGVAVTTTLSVRLFGRKMYFYMHYNHILSYLFSIYLYCWRITHHGVPRFVDGPLIIYTMVEWYISILVLSWTHLVYIYIRLRIKSGVYDLRVVLVVTCHTNISMWKYIWMD